MAGTWQLPVWVTCCWPSCWTAAVHSTGSSHCSSPSVAVAGSKSSGRIPDHCQDTTAAVVAVVVAAAAVAAAVAA